MVRLSIAVIGFSTVILGVVFLSLVSKNREVSPSARERVQVYATQCWMEATPGPSGLELHAFVAAGLSGTFKLVADGGEQDGRFQSDPLQPQLLEELTLTNEDAEARLTIRNETGGILCRTSFIHLQGA